MIDMNKKEIIKKLKEYNFDINNYMVISGAAMVILGLKESTHDIDIAVAKDYYDYLLNNYDCKFDRVNEFNNKCYIIDDIINFGIDYYNKYNKKVNNIPVQSINDILKLKQFLNRKKDIEDIEKIKIYIKEKNEK